MERKYEVAFGRMQIMRCILGCFFLGGIYGSEHKKVHFLECYFPVHITGGTQHE